MAFIHQSTFMEELIAFYKNQIELHTQSLAETKQQLLGSSLLRLLVFVGACLGVYFGLGNTKVVLVVVLLAIVGFLYLVSRHSNLVYKKDTYLALIRLNETELKVLHRDFKHLPTGEEFKDNSHAYSQDIDLFGVGSFFQYINRTSLDQGKVLLAQLATANDIQDITRKQEAIQELAGLPTWRQQFSAIASLVKTETKYTSIVKWLVSYKSFVPNIMQYVPAVFSIISLVLMVLFLIGLLSGGYILAWFLIGLIITGRYLKQTQKLSSDTNKIQSTFHQYTKLILEIEKQEYKSVLLQEKRNLIIQEKKAASTVLKEFSRILSALDQRNNLLVALLGNGFFLWDLRQGYALEQWIKNYGSKVNQWFSTIAFFDAYNSLGNFAFNHPTYTYPILAEQNLAIQAKDIGHPLLDPKHNVLNNFNMDNTEFFIITGANMAGKSTFLRTVSLLVVMSNMGLPVCGKEIYYCPIKLITSMRTADSLKDDESYFFSELKRLKFIVDQIQNEGYFIVLDEILKGTNSTDKAQGSRKFLDKLLSYKATGIIATHDLSLCEAADANTLVKNFYFDAEIKDNELYFDYKFKDGVCQNMNASFLLRKMQIVD